LHPTRNKGYRIMNRTKFLIAALAVLAMISCSNSNQSLCPDENHPHMIDLGLPNGTKWACCNVGAPAPEQYGGFYAWGETEVKSVYDEKHYSHGELSNQIPQSMGNITSSKYDAASEKQGSSWQMPSSEQWQELIDYCNWKWTTYQGHHGYKVTGPNGNIIFLPACGEKYNHDERPHQDERGAYWASNLNGKGEPYYLKFHDASRWVEHTYEFSPGFSIRAIASQGN